MDSDGDGFSNGQELGDPDGDGIVEAGSRKSLIQETQEVSLR